MVGSAVGGGPHRTFRPKGAGGVPSSSCPRCLVGGGGVGSFEWDDRPDRDGMRRLRRQLNVRQFGWGQRSAGSARSVVRRNPARVGGLPDPDGGATS